MEGREKKKVFSVGDAEEGWKKGLSPLPQVVNIGLWAMRPMNTVCLRAGLDR